MHLSDLLLYKEEIKREIKEVIPSSSGFSGRLDEDEVLAKHIRICLWKLRQKKPYGNQAAKEIIEELKLSQYLTNTGRRR